VEGSSSVTKERTNDQGRQPMASDRISVLNHYCPDSRYNIQTESKSWERLILKQPSNTLQVVKETDVPVFQMPMDIPQSN